MASIRPSTHLADVRYEIRGALTRRARELEAAGRDIIKLNIGNPGRYGFQTPAHLREPKNLFLASSPMESRGKWLSSNERPQTSSCFVRMAVERSATAWSA